MSSSNIEKQRAKLLMGTKYESWSMREILADLEDSEEASSLNEFFGRLTEELYNLKMTNLTNQKLIKTRLGVIDHVFKKIGVVKQNVVYEITR